jgi:hypothetical protein
MTAEQAEKLARLALSAVTVEEPESVADTTVLFLNADGTYSVVDNGESVDGLTADEAVRIICENLAD